MFPGQRDCELGRKLWNLKQTAAGTKHVSDRPQPQLETLLKEYGVGEEKIGRHTDPLKYIMFKTEDYVFIRVESDKTRGFPRGTVNSKILSGKGMEISRDDVVNRVKPPQVSELWKDFT